MKVHNVGFDTITEAISKKRRAYSAQSPLRNSFILDGKQLFVISRHQIMGQYARRVSDYPAFIFKSREKAQAFLEEVGADINHEVVSVFDMIRHGESASNASPPRSMGAIDDVNDMYGS